MTYTTFGKSAFAVTAILVAAACATSAEVPEEQQAQPQTGEDTSPSEPTTLPPAPPPTSTTPPSDRKCVPSCTADLDCANSCPATTGATPCCDLVTNTCYNSSTPMCPKSDPDAGTPPPAY